MSTQGAAAVWVLPRALSVSSAQRSCRRDETQRSASRPRGQLWLSQGGQRPQHLLACLKLVEFVEVRWFSVEFVEVRWSSFKLPWNWLEIAWNWKSVDFHWSLMKLATKPFISFNFAEAHTNLLNFCWKSLKFVEIRWTWLGIAEFRLILHKMLKISKTN